jgi:ParB/RepB/Spo0J family partition protein
MDQITEIRIDDLHESPFNPRKLFNEGALQELAADIKATGRVLQPLLVRPIVPPLFDGDPDGTAGHEIVFGHRRYRAAQLAGLTHVPCMVRAMTDEEAKRAQISENLQRADVHPIEEAEGFQALIDDHGMTADHLAEQTGKSRSYVYGRLKLLAACSEIRRACLAGEIGAEVALLVARLRTDKLQEKALGYIKADHRADLKDGGKASYRAVRNLLVEKFTLDLKTAMFDVQDATLLPIAGACVTCPKRSANAPEYADVVEGGHTRWGSATPGSANACTDPDCFDEKKKAHLKREAAKLIAEGKVVVDGNAARSAVSAHGEVKGAYIALKDVKADLKALPKKGSAAGHDAVQPQIVLLQDPRTGKTHQAVKRADLQAAGVKVKEAPKSNAANYAEQERKRQEANARLAEKAKRERAVRRGVFDAITLKLASTERSEFDLQLIAESFWAHVGWSAKRFMAQWYGVDDPEQLDERLLKMNVAELTVFLMHCALARDASPQDYEIGHSPDRLNATAAHYGVDVDQVRAELIGGAPTPSPAARAPADAKAAARGVKYRCAATGATWSGRGLQPAWLKAALAKGKKLSDFDVTTPAVPAGKQTDDAGGAGERTAQANALEEAAA